MTLVMLLTMIAEIYVHVIKGRGLGYDLSGNTVHLTFRILHVAMQNTLQRFMGGGEEIEYRPTWKSPSVP